MISEHPRRLSGILPISSGDTLLPESSSASYADQTRGTGSYLETIKFLIVGGLGAMECCRKHNLGCRVNLRGTDVWVACGAEAV